MEIYQSPLSKSYDTLLNDFYLVLRNTTVGNRKKRQPIVNSERRPYKPLQKTAVGNADYARSSPGGDISNMLPSYN
jgi:hypothetical protein